MANDFYQRFNLYGKEHPRFFFKINTMLCNAIALKRQSNFLESRPAHTNLYKSINA
jgi:hypothetical protein